MTFWRHGWKQVCFRDNTLDKGNSDGDNDFDDNYDDDNNNSDDNNDDK